MSYFLATLILFGLSFAARLVSLKLMPSQHRYRPWLHNDYYEVGDIKHFAIIGLDFLAIIFAFSGLVTTVATFT
jgi:hypothetical protein